MSLRICFGFFQGSDRSLGVRSQRLWWRSFGRWVWGVNAGVWNLSNGLLGDELNFSGRGSLSEGLGKATLSYGVVYPLW